MSSGPSSTAAFGERTTSASPSVGAGPSIDTRIVALDGLRGLMAIFVLVSHYFGELPGGIGALSFGWVGVDVFFVLSGFVVGRVILDKGRSANFYRVFYIRRACRTFPIYFVCLILTLAAVAVLAPDMARQSASLPVWSYFIFMQNIMMVLRQTIGAHWFLETWTLAVEEQFYLFAPALILLIPRKLLLPALVAIGIAAVALRFDLYRAGTSPLAGLVLLPTRADDLICGLIATLAVRGALVRGGRPAWRMAPVALLFGLAALRFIEGENGPLFAILGHLVIAIASACFLLSLVSGAPEAARFRAPWLRFCGRISYALYLCHLPILWLLHWLSIKAEPSLTTATGWAITALAVPISLTAAWLLTCAVGDPVTAWGRRWRWSDAPPAAGSTLQVQPAS